MKISPDREYTVWTMIYLMNMMDFDYWLAVHHSPSVAGVASPVENRANQSSDSITGEFPEIT